MKKRLTRIVCLIIVITMLGLTAASCGKKDEGDQKAASDKTWEFTINFTHGEVVSPNWSRVFGPDLQEASGGRIKPTIFWAGSLLSIPEIPKGL